MHKTLIQTLYAAFSCVLLVAPLEGGGVMLIGARNGMLVGEGKAEPYWGLCFTAVQANSTVAMTKVGSPDEISLLYSTDEKTWLPFVPGTTTVALANIGDSVWLRAGPGGNARLSASFGNEYRFSLTGRLDASGSLQSLLDGDNHIDTVPSSCFINLFRYNCNALRTTPELTATSIGGSAYRYMFFSNTGIVTARDIKAQIVSSNNAMDEMFLGCTSLVTGPEMDYNQSSYSYRTCYMMFLGCTALKKGPSILRAVHPGQAAYEQMFLNCRNLENAPKLMGTIMNGGAYTKMFSGCSKISEIEVALTAWPSFEVSDNWVSGVAATGTFRCPTSLGTDATIERGVNRCPNGWTVINTDV